jgi:hypothetical protein
MNDRIEELWGHFSNMSRDEQMKHVRRMRSDRRTRKEKATERKTRAVRSETARQRASMMISQLTPEQLARLARDMG